MPILEQISTTANRIAQLVQGPGNNAQARVSDVNTVIDTVNDHEDRIDAIENGTVDIIDVQVGDGTEAVPSIHFADDLNLGIYRINTDNAGFSANGAKVLDISATGLGVTGTIITDATVTATTGVITNTISELTGAAGVTADGVLLKDGGVSANSMFAGFYPVVAQNDIAAGTGGAIIVTNYLTTINTDGTDDAFTLANGAQIGQMKKILLVADGGGNGVVTPATAFAGGTTATFGDAADYLILMWNGTLWVVLENSGVLIA